jgi:cobalt-zinc-cadmium efflux system membrane fusion protein
MKLNIKILAILIAGAFMLPACHSGHDHEEEGHDHGNEAHEEHGDHEEGAEEAHLSEAQFQSLEMKVGPLPERNLGAYIEANGQLEVPPQNEALVSTYIGANVVSIEVIEGDKVSQGKVLAYLSHPDIIQLQTDYLSAYNSLTYLEKDYLRQKKLYEENVGSGKDLQRLEAEFLSAKGKSNGYEAQLKLLGLSIDEINAGNVHERIPVRSPIDGHVRKVEVKTGQFVEPQKDLFDIVNVEHIHADLMVFEKDVHKVREGQKVLFSVEGHDEYDLEAVIYSVGKAFENDPKAVHLHAEIENKHGVLLPGMYVRGRIMSEENLVTAVPEEAVVNEAGKDYVFTANSLENKEWEFIPVEVKVGTRSDGLVSITLISEAKENETFALNNAYYLMAQMKKGEAGHEH